MSTLYQWATLSLLRSLTHMHTSTYKCMYAHTHTHTHTESTTSKQQQKICLFLPLSSGEAVSVGMTLSSAIVVRELTEPSWTLLSVFPVESAGCLLSSDTPLNCHNWSAFEFESGDFWLVPSLLVLDAGSLLSMCSSDKAWPFSTGQGSLAALRRPGEDNRFGNLFSESLLEHCSGCTIPLSKLAKQSVNARVSFSGDFIRSGEMFEDLVSMPLCAGKWSKQSDALRSQPFADFDTSVICGDSFPLDCEHTSPFCTGWVRLLSSSVKRHKRGWAAPDLRASLTWWLVFETVGDDMLQSFSFVAARSSIWSEPEIHTDTWFTRKASFFREHRHDSKTFTRKAKSYFL